MKVVKSILLVLLCMATAYSQPKNEAHKEARKEARAYMRENIWPVVKAERQAFDSQLSDAEKAAIAEARAKLDGLRPKKGKKNHGNPPSEEERKAMHQARKAILETVKPIAEAHRDQLKAIAEAHKTDMERWKADLLAIMEKHGIERPNGQENGPEHGDRPKHEGKPHHGPHFMKPFKGAHFLLIDPNGMGNEDDEEAEAMVFPNPATAKSQLQVDFPSAGQAKVELLDRNGKLLQTVFEGFQPAGQQTFELDATQLPSSVYFYRITTNGGVVTKRFSVTK